MLIDILTIATVASVAFVAGMRTSIYLLRARLMTALQGLHEVKSQDRNQTMLLRVEQMQDQIYCYEAETNRFICQGTDVAEIWSTFQKLFPNVNARVISGETALLDKVREQARVINEVV
jgi:hypothetical protein